ncbi:MAG: sugar transferase [Actinobacteria bacterium]|nr:sugar transferase [Actinomycetota bacterium]
MRSTVLKRTIDIVGSSLGLLVAAVPMAVLALLIRRDIGKPVLFLQVRPGRDAKPFTLVKFRTMREGPGSDAERLTPLGRFIRSLSLDELPELWNVLRGDMSLVGPRPLLTSYLPRYSPHQARRHEVRPGLTGLAQVQGRNTLSWEHRFELDVHYVDTWSVRLDLAIIARTLWLVVKRDGITAEGHATMPEFLGEHG